MKQMKKVRYKSMIIHGKPILDLPQKHILYQKAGISINEKKVYDGICAYAEIQMKAWKEQQKRAKQAKQAKLGLSAAHGDSTTKADYINALEAILRLRQNCCDPLLLLDGIDSKDAKNEEAQDDLMYGEGRDDTAVERTVLS